MNDLLRRCRALCGLVLLLAGCRPVQDSQAFDTMTPTPSWTLAPFSYEISPLLTATAPQQLEASGISSPTSSISAQVTAMVAPICTSWHDLDAAFVADVELPDNTRMPPFTPFRKTWRLRNTGTCTWPEGIQLSQVAGDKLPGPGSVPLIFLAPGSEIDVSINFTAPARPGVYESYWRLQEPGGQLVGAVVFVRIVVDPLAAYDSERVTPLAASPVAVVRPTVSTVTPPSTTPLVVPTLATVTLAEPTVVALAPAAATCTPLPTSPSISTPLPTPYAVSPIATPTQNSGNVCRVPDSRFAAVVDLAAAWQLKVPCARSGVTEEAGLVQFYWPNSLTSQPVAKITENEKRSIVIVAQESRQIYVLDRRNTEIPLAGLSVYHDTWHSALPETAPTCDILVPPDAAVFPTRGIGLVWCAESLWLTIGWPTSAPRAAHLLVQEIWGGLLMEVREGTKTYMIAIDNEQYRAVIDESR